MPDQIRLQAGRIVRSVLKDGHRSDGLLVVGIGDEHFPAGDLAKNAIGSDLVIGRYGGRRHGIGILHRKFGAYPGEFRLPFHQAGSLVIGFHLIEAGIGIALPVHDRAAIFLGKAGSDLVILQPQQIRLFREKNTKNGKTAYNR